MIWAYRIGLYIAIPFAIIGLIMRGFRNRLYWLRWGERFGFIAPEIKQAAPFDLWIHAVSVGEVRAAVPLVDRLISEQPDISILLTSTTPTGSEMVKLMLYDKVAHCYFPYDLGWAMRRLVRVVNALSLIHI